MRTRPIFDLRIAGRKIRLGERTLIMGVVNVTPDSFSDGGLYLDTNAAVERGLELAEQGADWIDVGGESTRPASKPISDREELRRVVPVIERLRRALDHQVSERNGKTAALIASRDRRVEISVDTTKAIVAEAAMQAGAAVVNDVSGLRFDSRVAEVVRQYAGGLVLMHLRGRPETMQQGPFARSIWRSLAVGLGGSIRRALSSGLKRSQLIIDPGLGFGKTRRQNFQILAELHRLNQFRLPVMVGTSRKSFVQAIAAGEGLTVSGQGRNRPSNYWRLLNAEKLRSGNPAGHVPLEIYTADAGAVTASVLGGAHIIRVHDVNAVLPAARVADALLAAART
jgi:dihydropteroate synthase